MRLVALAVACVATSTMGALAQQPSSTTWHICVITVSGSDNLLAFTEPFAYAPSHGRGMGQINESWQTYISRVYRGTVDIGIDAKRMSGGFCGAGSRNRADADQYFARLRSRNPGAVVIQPPMDSEGDLPRRQAGASSATPATAPKAEAAKPEGKAELVDTPQGKILMSPRKKAEYEAKLAENARLTAERERTIAENAARHAANKAAAEARQAAHEKEMAEHREKVAQMERDAAQVRAEWAQRVAGLDPKKPEEEKVEFKEGVVMCQQRDPQSPSVNCRGPLQNVSTVLDTPAAAVAIGQACGSDRSVRDLGMVKGYRTFGCGFGIHPTARDYPGNTDVAAALGIDFVPGRGSYFCPTSKLAYCRE